MTSKIIIVLKIHGQIGIDLSRLSLDFLFVMPFIITSVKVLEGLLSRSSIFICFSCSCRSKEVIRKVYFIDDTWQATFTSEALRWIRAQFSERQILDHIRVCSSTLNEYSWEYVRIVLKYYHGVETTFALRQTKTIRPLKLSATNQ